MKKIRYLIEYFLVKFWLGITKILSLKNSTRIASAIFQFIGMRLKVTNIARRNLQKAFPDLSASKINQIILEVWHNFGYMAAETSVIMEMSQDNFVSHVKVTGIENLLKYKDQAALIYTAHLGNWELLGKAVVPYGIKFTAIFRRANNIMVDKVIDDIRHNIDVNMIPKGKAGAKQLIAALQNNQHVVMLVDQKMNDGIKVPFLGRDAMTAPAIATLALKYNCPIIPAQVIRHHDSNFEIIFYPNLDHQGKSVQEIMLEINQQIGQWVTARPGQWFWLHKRWID